MDNALDLVRELKARTKEACINPACQDGCHMCDPCGSCCDGCKVVGEALRHLNNLRVEYFEVLLEAADLLACSACGDAGCSCLGCRLEQTLTAIAENAKKALS